MALLIKYTPLSDIRIKAPNSLFVYILFVSIIFIYIFTLKGIKLK